MDGMEKQRKLYPHRAIWWERVAKNELRKFLIREGAIRRRDDIALGYFYHAALYHPLKSPPRHEDKIVTINLIKVKLVRLYGASLRHGIIELKDTDALQTERQPSTN
jgi:hypothetical protein